MDTARYHELVKAASIDLNDFWDVRDKIELWRWVQREICGNDTIDPTEMSGVDPLGDDTPSDECVDTFLTGVNEVFEEVKGKL